MKYFVIDTNVLIHNPMAIYSFSDNTVVIPLTVIEELDTFKTLSDKKGMHAREVLREIDACIKKGALKKGAKIKSGGKLLIAMSSKLKNMDHLDSSKHDNLILATALELQKTGNKVFFVSKDVNARIKAEALGIKARDFEKQKVEYTSLYKGWRTINLSKKEINKLFENGSLAIPKDLTPLLNEYFCLQAIDDEETSALCTADLTTNTFIPMKKHLEAMGIQPINLEQQFAFDLLLRDDIKFVTLVGPAGTGKTLLALACGLQKVLDNKSYYEKLLVARPIIPLGKDIGYLPGDKDKKLNYWMQPIFDNLNFIMHFENDLDKISSSQKSYDKVNYLLESKIIEIEALTYIRGRSIPRQFIIIDEVQNLTPHEVKTIISRAGENTKIVLTGDPEQIDNPYLDSNSNGLTYVAERFKGQEGTGHVFLSKSERSYLASLAVDLL
jgi:PhoH-like ATPase